MYIHSLLLKSRHSSLKGRHRQCVKLKTKIVVGSYKIKFLNEIFGCLVRTLPLKQQHFWFPFTKCFFLFFNVSRRVCYFCVVFIFSISCGEIRVYSVSLGEVVAWTLTSRTTSPCRKDEPFLSSPLERSWRGVTATPSLSSSATATAGSRHTRHLQDGHLGAWGQDLVQASPSR